ncbi:MAG TPA: hypothetical protein VOA64_02875 [Candidatus Dormibacteraeota bacterium]|nr:hypothetical protein [Candidatus Dormibacteraeota bacterium]
MNRENTKAAGSSSDASQGTPGTHDAVSLIYAGWQSPQNFLVALRAPKAMPVEKRAEPTASSR